MLQNGDWTKATIRGKKCALVVVNNDMWLLSYVREWDIPNQTGYETVREGFRHGFHCWMKIEVEVCGCDDWNNWRDNNEYAEFDPEEIKFPGEEGFEREIRRYRRNREGNAPLPPNTTAPAAPANEGEGIDFYLPNYSRNNVYQGMHSYHNSHRAGFLNLPRVPFTGHRIGIELEMEAKNGNYYHEITERKSNWFTRESDASLGSNGIELITIPLLPDDAKSYATWMPLIDFLKVKANSWNTEGRCGLHVHIGREILGDTEAEQQITLGKLLIFYQGEIENWDAATATFGRARCYHQPDGDTDELKAVKLLGKNVLKDNEVFNIVDRAMKRKFNGNRYFAVNLTNAHTIEFRKGRGSLNADRIIAIITFVEAICLFCRSVEPNELTIDNFKSYLYRNIQCGHPLYRYLGFQQADA